MLKKILYYQAVFLSFLYSFIPQKLLLAKDFGLKATGETAGYSVTGDKSNIYGLLGMVIGTVLSLLGVLFVILMLYGGFRWMTARGNQEFVDKAKKIIEMATVGLIIILLSYALSSFIFGKLVV